MNPKQDELKKKKIHTQLLTSESLEGEIRS